MLLERRRSAASLECFFQYSEHEYEQRLSGRLSGLLLPLLSGLLLSGRLSGDVDERSFSSEDKKRACSEAGESTMHDAVSWGESSSRIQEAAENSPGLGSRSLTRAGLRLRGGQEDGVSLHIGGSRGGDPLACLLVPCRRERFELRERFL